MGPHYGWRAPFYVGAAPGFVLALLLLLIPEPPLGQFDPHEKTPDRDTLRGLARNPAFLTATFGMAMMTFALGGLQVWMPTFLHRARGYTLGQAGIFFGLSIGANGLVASLAGGWLSDFLLRKTRTAHYLVSAVSLGLGIPAMWVALYTQGRFMVAGILVAEFLLLLNTGPLNAAIINSVGAPIRAMALAVNIFIFHLFGDVPSLGADRLHVRSLFAAACLPRSRHRRWDFFCHTLLWDEIRSARAHRGRSGSREDLGRDGLFLLDCGNDSGAVVVLPHCGCWPWNAFRC